MTRTYCYRMLVAAVLVAAAGVWSSRLVADGGADAGQGRGGGMMAQRAQMAAAMAERERRLDDLITRMQAATGAAKVEAIAAALAELVAQHKAMRGQMMGGMMAPPAAATPPPAAPVPPRADAQAGGDHDHQAANPDEMCVPEA